MMKRHLSEHEKLTKEQRSSAVMPALIGIPTAFGVWALGSAMGLRNLPHVPFDLSPFEHLGNVAPTLPVALAAPVIAAALEKYVSADRITRTRRIAAAGTIGLVLGAGWNATTETTFGNDHIGRHLSLIEYKKSVPLASDLIWGTVSAAIVAGGAAAWRDSKIAANQKSYDMAASGGVSVPLEAAGGTPDITSIASTLPISNETLADMQVIPVVNHAD